MKKKYFILIMIGFLSLFLAVPFLLGIAIQDQYEKNLPSLSGNLKLSVKLLSYKRSWFTSDALIATNFPLADKLNDINRLSEEKDGLIIQ